MCYSLWYHIMNPRCCLPVVCKRSSSASRLPAGNIVGSLYGTTSCNTQSSAPEDGRDHRSKHVELIGIIDKLLLLHIVYVYITYVNDALSNKYQTEEDILFARRVLFESRQQAK